jgi:hypothetical protein
MICIDCGTEKQSWHAKTSIGCIQCHNLRSAPDTSDFLFLSFSIGSGLLIATVALVYSMLI